MRLKGPSTSRPASYLNIDRKRRTPSVIARFNDKMYIILHIRNAYQPKSEVDWHYENEK
jgi:hypothetical protein